MVHEHCTKSRFFLKWLNGKCLANFQFGHSSWYCMHTRNLVFVGIFSSILKIAGECNSKHCSDSLKYNSIFFSRPEKSLWLFFFFFCLYLWEIKIDNVLGFWNSCYMKWKPLFEQFKCSSIVPPSLSGPIKCILL